MDGDVADAGDLPCSICDRLLGYSSDDQPDWPTGRICGDCYGARQVDDELWWSAESGADL